MSEQVVYITAAPHSVELSRNASGGTSFAVKVYAASPEEALAKAKEVYAGLDAEFPAAVKEKK